VHDLRDRNLALRFGSAVASIEIGAGGPADHQARRWPQRHHRNAAVRRPAASAPSIISISGAVGIDVDNRGHIKVEPKTMQTTVPHISPPAT